MNESGRVGTLGWAHATGGRLRPGDRMRLLGQGVAAQLRELPWQLGALVGLRPGRLARFDVGALRIPDSPASRDAEQLCSELRPALLVNHSYRTYAWAAVLAAHDGLRYDEEVLYVSSLLHDLGLSDRHRPAPPPTCFTLVGARAAEGLGRSDSWDDRRARLTAEAITLHMNLRVRPSEGVEAHLLTAGTQLDAIGARYWSVHPDTVAAVLEKYPREGVKAGLVSLFAEEARSHPGSRAHLYSRYLGSRWRLRTAPFEQ